MPMGFKYLKQGWPVFDEDECVKLSDEIGYPVVLKIASPDIVHKVM